MPNLFMKKTLVVLILSLTAASLSVTKANNRYWVYFRDKQGSSFDPYSYFDAHAIERRKAMGVLFTDSTDFPVNETYTKSVESICGKTKLASRWLNAVSVNLSEN